MNPDPYRQYASPYKAMGNNPIYMTDPDGGCADDDYPCWEAAFDAGFWEDEARQFQNWEGLVSTKLQSYRERNEILGEWSRLFQNDPEGMYDVYNNIATLNMLHPDVGLPRVSEVFPPTIEELMNLNGTSFGGIDPSMNRTDNLRDGIKWKEFLEDYEKDPKKYQDAAHRWIHKHFGPYMNKKED